MKKSEIMRKSAVDFKQIKYKGVIIISFWLFCGLSMLNGNSIEYIIENIIVYWIGLTGVWSILLIIGELIGHDIRIFEDK